MTIQTQQQNKSAILVRVEPDVYADAQERAAGMGATVTGVMRALIHAWLASPSVPLIPSGIPVDSAPQGQ
jgi:antitoxin component of RelBE/YafQ-DinJ toxin-antitoxin module